MEPTQEPVVHFLNVEYFFRLLYEFFTQQQGSASVSFSADILSWASTLWMLVTGLSVLVTVGLLIWFAHSNVRYHQARREELEKYATLSPVQAETVRDHNRWEHIRELVSRPHESDWRQAIIEADIMLDDLLSQLGYVGQSVGEKLRAVDPNRFQSLEYAWEAHKVRNRIAHEGSAFDLTERLAHRTIAQYEVVMREHGEI